MDPEKAQVITGAQAWHDQLLFGLAGGRFFNDVVDFIKIVLPRNAVAADSAIKGQHVFARGLNGRDSAILRPGSLDDLLGTSRFGFADIKVIAYKMQEWF